jgi:hypothetical protein
VGPAPQDARPGRNHNCWRECTRVVGTIGHRVRGGHRRTKPSGPPIAFRPMTPMVPMATAASTINAVCRRLMLNFKKSLSLSL